jgi:hypothetical protein
VACVSSGTTRSRASSHEVQKLRCAVHEGQRSVGVRATSRFVSQLSGVVLPRKERVMRRLVWSTARKPVTSVGVGSLGVGEV